MEEEKQDEKFPAFSPVFHRFFVNRMPIATFPGGCTV
jgi:hypothetical protein